LRCAADVFPQGRYFDWCRSGPGAAHSTPARQPPLRPLTPPVNIVPLTTCWSRPVTTTKKTSNKQATNKQQKSNNQLGQNQALNFT
jgi:hypothetical protein